MATVGKLLREAREARGLTIDDIQQLTKIQKRYLESLENDDFSTMPGTFYVRGFIRQYAEAVALDSSKVLSVFDGESPGLDERQTGNSSIEKVEGSRMKNHGGGNKKGKIGWPVIVLTIVVIVLSGSIFYVTFKDWNSKKPLIDRQESVEVDRNQSTTETSSLVASESSTASVESSTSSSEVAKSQLELINVAGSETNMVLKNATAPVNIEFTGVNGACWIGILVNGEYVYQNSLDNGIVATTELPAGTQDATIVLGASGNVKVKVNSLDMNFNPDNTGSVKRNVNLKVEYAADATTTDGSTTEDTETPQ